MCYEIICMILKYPPVHYLQYIFGYEILFSLAVANRNYVASSRELRGGRQNEKIKEKKIKSLSSTAEPQL